MSEDAPFESLTKLEAAERQLRVAIRLFFECKDLVAVHTLAAASREVLNDLAKKQGIKTFSAMHEDLIRPEKLKEFRAILRRAQNFFKHADRDSEDKIDFYYGATKMVLFEAVVTYGLLKAFFSEAQFHAWFLLKHPNIVRDEQFKKSFLAAMRGVNPDNFDVILAVTDAASKK